MKSCIADGCGRKFENEQTMLEHARRRHPEQYEAIKMKLSKTLIQT